MEEIFAVRARGQGNGQVGLGIKYYKEIVPCGHRTTGRDFHVLQNRAVIFSSNNTQQKVHHT